MLVESNDVQKLAEFSYPMLKMMMIMMMIVEKGLSAKNLTDVDNEARNGKLKI